MYLYLAGREKRGRHWRQSSCLLPNGYVHIASSEYVCVFKSNLPLCRCSFFCPSSLSTKSSVDKRPDQACDGNPRCSHEDALLCFVMAQFEIRDAGWARPCVVLALVLLALPSPLWRYRHYQAAQWRPAMFFLSPTKPYLTDSNSFRR